MSLNSATMQITVNGTLIKVPTKVTPQRFNLTKAGRVSSGKMMMELVAKKRKLKMEYATLSGTDLVAIRNLIDTQNMFFTVTWVENGIQETATMYVGEIEYERFRTDGIWYWKNVKFDFIEQ